MKLMAQIKLDAEPHEVDLRGLEVSLQECIEREEWDGVEVDLYVPRGEM
jgi:hypothetical protein